MKTALFISRYYWPEMIGSPRFSTELAEWLTEHGRATTVVSGFPHYPYAEIFPAYRRWQAHCEYVHGVAIERLRSGPPRNASAKWRIVNEVGFLLRGLAALATGRIKRDHVVLALCPSILSVALGVASRKRGGICVAIVHDIQSGLAEQLGMSGGRMAKLMRVAERTILNQTDLVVVLTAEMRQQLQRIGVTTPIEVVPIWVDTEQLQPAPTVQRLRTQVLYSGNLGRKQGLGQVIDLARALALQRPDIEITLRGNGNQAEELAAEINRWDLTNIRMAELSPNEELGAALAQGDIHLVPQLPEAADFAVPSKVYNIMAVGRPFVATALHNSALGVLQKESQAFLCVPPNDPKAFAAAITKLADDHALRQEMGRRGRAFVEQHYAKTLILDRLAGRLDALAGAAATGNLSAVMP